jgi:hypothetical protein
VNASRGLSSSSLTLVAMPLQLEEFYSPEYLRHYGVLPRAIVDGKLQVAIHGTTDDEVLEDLECAFGCPVALEPVDEDELTEGIEAAFASLRTAPAASEMAEPAYEAPTPRMPATSTSNPPAAAWSRDIESMACCVKPPHRLRLCRRRLSPESSS